MKHRIIKRERGMGEIFYTPQRRIFGIWLSFKELLQGGAERTINFDTRNKAIDFIENDKKLKRVRNVVVYRDEN